VQSAATSHHSRRDGLEGSSGRVVFEPAGSAPDGKSGFFLTAGAGFLEAESGTVRFLVANSIADSAWTTDAGVRDVGHAVLGPIWLPADLYIY
jgi:hypothetical protein